MRAAAFWNDVRHLADEHDAALGERRERLFERLLPTLTAVETSTDGLTDSVHTRLGFRLPPAFDTEPCAGR